MGKVLVVMGSDSDFPVMEGCFKMLKKFNIGFDAVVCSAHRTPDKAFKIAKEARSNGYSIIIAAAGLAAHLGGVLAANTVLPVIGVPLSGSVLDGTDALYSIVQMPPGIPVATVAINGAKNAAWLALEIMAIKHEDIHQRLLIERKNMAEAAAKANAEVIAKFEN